MKVEEAQKLLESDEAFVFFLTGAKESYVFALTASDYVWHTIPIGAEDLADEIEDFRSGLDVSQPEQFDLDQAYRLFGLLMAPVDAVVKDKHNLLIVPSGALTALPFQLLVTEKPAAAPTSQSKGYITPEEAARHRDAAWLIKRQAITVLPSGASLRTLRSPVRANLGLKPMIGFGDPVFAPSTVPGDNTRGAHARGGVRILRRLLAGRRYRSRDAGFDAAEFSGYSR